MRQSKGWNFGDMLKRSRDTYGWCDLEEGCNMVYL